MYESHANRANKSLLKRFQCNENQKTSITLYSEVQCDQQVNICSHKVFMQPESILIYPTAGTTEYKQKYKLVL